MFDIGSYVRSEGITYKVIADSEVYNLLETNKYVPSSFTIADILEDEPFDIWAERQYNNKNLYGDLRNDMKENLYYLWIDYEDIEVFKFKQCCKSAPLMETE